MKRIIEVFRITAVILSGVLLLCGCSRIQNKVTELMWENSGVPEDLSYVQYQQMDAAGALDPSGTYHSAELETLARASAREPSGSVHVSFARNDFLDISYYLDEALTQPLDTSDCWLNPGDVIHAPEPKLTNPNSSLYRFSAFRVVEFDSFGGIHQLAEIMPELPGAVFTIPENYTGTELSIIPLGKYQQITVTLNGGYVDSGRLRTLENGIWEINGKRYGNVSVLLDPTESYRVIYDYSAYKDDWYFVSSVPESYWENDGTITFIAGPTNSGQVDYSVLLHPYGKMTIHNSVSFQNAIDSLWDSAAVIFGNRSVIETQNIIELLQVNGITSVNNFSDTEITVPNLKVGDEILIRVPSELKIIAEGLTLPSSTLKENSREYRFTVPDTESMAFTLSVSRRNSDVDGVFHQLSVARGTLAVRDSLGIEYREGSELPAEDERVTVTITPDENYCIYGKNVKNNVYQAEMKYADFAANCATIIAEHPIRPGIIVTLVTEDELGTCVFWTGNEQISGTVVLREGQDLQFDYLLDPDFGYGIILTKEERENSVNVWSPYAASRELDVTEALNGRTLRCRDFVTLEEGVKNDILEDHF